MHAVLCALLITLVFRIILWFNLRLRSSSLSNIPGPPRASLLTGNLQQLFDKQKAWDFHDQISEQYGSASAVNGVLGEKILYVFDPKALQTICAQGQYTFDHPEEVINRNYVIFGPGLFAATGERHRRQRKIISYAFSPANLRRMTSTFYRVTHQLCDAMSTAIDGSESIVDVLAWLSRASLEIIAQCGAGGSLVPFDRPVQAPVADALRKLVPTLVRLDPWRGVLKYVNMLGPPWLRKRIAMFVPIANARRMSWIVEVLDQASKNMVAAKFARASQKGDAVSTPNHPDTDTAKDILSVLVNNGANSDRLNQDELVSLLSTILFAGSDTSSTAIATVLQVLSKHPDAQKKLRDEIVSARKGQDLSYDELHALPYLDSVCRETLRLYPPVNFSMKATQADVVLPLSTPLRGNDGTMLDSIFLRKGTNILISISSYNRDKTRWGDDALEWKPDRWLAPLPEAVVNSQIPGAFSHQMTFLGGGRSCIGLAFAHLEIKIVLSVLLEVFEFLPSTQDKIQWNWAAVNYPSTDSDGSQGCLPLLVRRRRAGE